MDKKTAIDITSRTNAIYNLCLKALFLDLDKPEHKRCLYSALTAVNAATTDIERIINSIAPSNDDFVNDATNWLEDLTGRH